MEKITKDDNFIGLVPSPSGKPAKQKIVRPPQGRTPAVNPLTLKSAMNLINQ